MMVREPDLEITAAVRADEVRFESKPRVQVRVYADVPVSAEFVSERENLPDTIKPGVTYRDFAVRWRAAAYLEDQDLSAYLEDPDSHECPKAPGSDD